MKKCNFYSLIGQNGKITVKPWEGYTDGIFNYYKNEYNTWYCIEPSTGLSIGSDRVRKNLYNRVNTPNMYKMVNEKITQEMIFRFKDKILEYEMEKGI